MKLTAGDHIVGGVIRRTRIAAALGLLSVIISVVGGAALGVKSVLPVSARAVAVAPTTVQGAWQLTPAQGGHAEAFQLISCFAAGGVFITTGSDKPGTGLGEWSSVGSNGFAFTYLTFHFGQNGNLNNAVKVRARGTFHGSTLTGQLTATPVDPYGTQGSPSLHFTVTGKRITVQSS